MPGLARSLSAECKSIFPLEKCVQCGIFWELKLILTLFSGCFIAFWELRTSNLASMILYLHFLLWFLIPDSNDGFLYSLLEPWQGKLIRGLHSWGVSTLSAIGFWRTYIHLVDKNLRLKGGLVCAPSMSLSEITIFLVKSCQKTSVRSVRVLNRFPKVFFPGSDPKPRTSVWSVRAPSASLSPSIISCKSRSEQKRFSM